MSKREIETLVATLVHEAKGGVIDASALTETIYKRFPGIITKTEILALIDRRSRAEDVPRR